MNEAMGGVRGCTAGRMRKEGVVAGATSDIYCCRRDRVEELQGKVQAASLLPVRSLATWQEAGLSNGYSQTPSWPTGCRSWGKREGELKDYDVFT